MRSAREWLHTYFDDMLGRTDWFSPEDFADQMLTALKEAGYVVVKDQADAQLKLAEAISECVGPLISDGLDYVLSVRLRRIDESIYLTDQSLAASQQGEASIP